jgi:hypothetical protein
MGHQEILGPNEIQRMSAGTGIRHSEFNPSGTDPLHFFQIWIEPATVGTKPSYEQLRFDPEEKKNRLKLLAGPEGGEDGGDGVARINQDARLFVADLQGTEVTHSLGVDRAAWVHVVRGEIGVNGTPLRTGDAVAATGEENVTLSGTGEILLFDLA